MNDGGRDREIRGVMIASFCMGLEVRYWLALWGSFIYER